MAKATTDNKITAPEMIQEAPYDPWKDMYQIKLARDPASSETSKFVAVNGKTFQVPIGKIVAVPRPVYDVLESASKAEEISAAYDQKLESTVGSPALK